MNDTLTIINEQEVLGKDFKIYGSIEEPLFLAKDVAEWIEHSNTSKMLNTVDDDEKVKAILPLTNSYTQEHGGLRENTECLFLTEDGLYEVLMQSRKPVAKQFKKEVKKILKQIRQTGGYIPVTSGAEPLSDEQIMAKALIIAQRTIEKRNKEIETAKQVITQKDAELQNAANEIGIMKPKAEFYDVLNKDYESTYTATTIAKLYGLSAKKFNELLHGYGVQYKTDGHWVLYSKWDNKGLVIYESIPTKKADGTPSKTRINMVFTGHGFVWVVTSLALRGIYPNDMSTVPKLQPTVKSF